MTKVGMIFSLQLAYSKAKPCDRPTDTYIARNLTSINEKKNFYLLHQLTKDAAAIKPLLYSHPRG